MNINDKTFKRCFDIYKKTYRLKRKLNGQSEWSVFPVSKSDLKRFITYDLNIGGTELKPFPYKNRFLLVIKWYFKLFVRFIKKTYNNIDKRLKSFFGGGFWKLIIGILAIIYALIKFNIINLD